MTIVIEFLVLVFAVAIITILYYGMNSAKSIYTRLGSFKLLAVMVIVLAFLIYKIVIDTAIK